VRNLVLDKGWDSFTVKKKSARLALLLEAMEGFKTPEYKWMDLQRKSMAERFSIIAKDDTLPDEAMSLHFTFLWKELEQWAATSLHSTRWSKLQVCIIRKRDLMRASPGQRKLIS
jgi:hypothetical protein